MTLYSLNGAAPAPLPTTPAGTPRIRIPDGAGGWRTRTGTFTPEELAAAGYVEAGEAPQPTARQLEAEWVDGAWVLPDKPVATRKAEMKTAAGTEHDSRAPTTRTVAGEEQAISADSAAACLTRRSALYVAIDGAADHDALDAIDTGSGWPVVTFLTSSRLAARSQHNDSLERKARKLASDGDAVGAINLRLRKE